MARTSIFGRGYKEVEQEADRQEEARKNAGMKLWDFFIVGDKSEADVRFLTEEPVNFMEHTEQVYVNGKERWEKTVCSEDENCPLCAKGDKPTFKGAYLVVDRREFEYKKDGKTVTGKDQLRMYVQGTRVLSQLDRISTKYGLSDKDVTIVRLGTGTSTTYTIERGDTAKLSPKEIENFLPETMREDYDGTMESLYKIVEKQLLMRFPEGVVEEEEVEEESINESIINVDEEEEIKVKEGKPFKVMKLKPKENNIKSIIKKRDYTNDDIPF